MLVYVVLIGLLNFELAMRSLSVQPPDEVVQV